jgi:hypothetical protein
MANGLAGSSSSLDRRRRLMSMDEIAASDGLLSEFGVVVGAESAVSCERLGDGDPILSRLISHRLWKHLLIIVPLMALLSWPAFAVVVPDFPAGSRSTISENSFGSSRMVSWRTAEGLSGTLVFVAGQLCLVIFQARSRSAVDFRGRYRAWNWLGALLVATGLLLTTDLTGAATSVVAGLLEPVTGPLQAARPALLIVPGLAVGAFVLTVIVPDMSRCRGSQLLLVCSVVLGTAAIAAQAGQLRSLVTDNARMLMLLYAAGSGFSSCLLHARYVIHVSNDPPVTASRRSADAGTKAQPDTASAVVAADGETAAFSGEVQSLRDVQSPGDIESPGGVQPPAEVRPEPRKSRKKSAGRKAA